MKVGNAKSLRIERLFETYVLWVSTHCFFIYRLYALLVCLIEPFDDPNAGGLPSDSPDNAPDQQSAPFPLNQGAEAEDDALPPPDLAPEPQQDAEPTAPPLYTGPPPEEDEGSASGKFVTHFLFSNLYATSTQW